VNAGARQASYRIRINLLPHVPRVLGERSHRIGTCTFKLASGVLAQLTSVAPEWYSIVVQVALLRTFGVQPRNHCAFSREVPVSDAPRMTANASLATMRLSIWSLASPSGSKSNIGRVRSVDSTLSPASRSDCRMACGSTLKSDETSTLGERCYSRGSVKET
jgi:hypothetical protein